MMDAKRTIKLLNELYAMGLHLSIDDFGTGYSSLAYLRRFPVDKIKIDRSFVASLGESESADGLIDAVVKLAHSFNLAVIAEGVETELQRSRLSASGCQMFQGFLLGKPVAAAEIDARYLAAPDRVRQTVNSRR